MGLDNLKEIFMELFDKAHHKEIVNDDDLKFPAMPSMPKMPEFPKLKLPRKPSPPTSPRKSVKSSGDDDALKKLFDELFDNPPTMGQAAKNMLGNPPKVNFSGVSLPSVGGVASAPGTSAVIGTTPQPLGQMNPGVVYAPYIPLITTDMTDEVPPNAPKDFIGFHVPLWMGELRNGGFHDLVSSAYRNTLNPQLKKIVEETLLEFSEKFSGTEFNIIIACDGPNLNSVTFVRTFFKSIFPLLVDDKMTEEWTTPLRMKLFMSKNDMKHCQRMIYGGHFYATGHADAEESPVEPSGSDISKITIGNIFWEDYRSKSKKPIQLI